MARGKHKLSSRFVEAIEKAGHHSDGHGLYLIVRASGSKSWSYIWIKRGKRREMGLGGLSKVSLELAREKAKEISDQIGRGLDPFVERSSKQITFGEVADMLLARLSDNWSNDKSRQQWFRSLKVLAAPLTDKYVSEIQTSDIVHIVTPVLEVTPETGKRLRARVERTIDFATAHGWRSGDNPARWNGHLENILISTVKKPRSHFSALPYNQLPNFMTALRGKTTVSAYALAFTILTAARTGEAIGATWSEIDFQKKVWIVPSARMKARVEHSVPLSASVMSILSRLHKDRQSEYIFHGKNPKNKLSDMGMTMTLRRMGFGNYTVHGFRSTFRDYVGDQTSVPREIAEAALSHRVGNAVENAYRRGTALEKRRELMEKWDEFCNKE